GRGCARARGARRGRAEDGLAAGQGRHPAASGRRAGLSRERLDEIAADWIFENGRIITLDPRRPSATGLAIEADRVVAVGGRADLRRWRHRPTRVVDLAG